MALAKLNNWPDATLTSGQYNLAGQLYSMMTAVRLEPPDITMILMLDHKVAYSRALAAAGKDNVKDKYEANGFEEYQARAKDYNAVAYLATGSQYKMCGKTVIGVPYSPLESVEDVRTVILNRLLQEQSFVKLLPVSNG
jgi:thymidylate kinase